MSQAKILIVDDDADTRLGLAGRFEATGYGIVFAADGVTALTQAVKQRPDLILLDLGMPGGDGFTVLRRLKANLVLKDVPVVVLSARDAVDNRERALVEGAAAYFQKPADNDALMGEVASCIALRRDGKAS